MNPQSNIKIKELLILLSICILTTILICSYTKYKNEKSQNIVILNDGSVGLINPPNSLEMYELLEEYSKKYEIPKFIIYNIAYLETRYQGPFHWNYKPHQTSFAGAVGPMQIMPATANMIKQKKISVKKLKNNIELNIEISTKLLNKLYKKYGDWKIVCGCYNTGRPIVNDYARFCVENKDYRKNWIKF